MNAAEKFADTDHQEPKWGVQTPSCLPNCSKNGRRWGRRLSGDSLAPNLKKPFAWMGGGVPLGCIYHEPLAVGRITQAKTPLRLKPSRQV